MLSHINLSIKRPYFMPFFNNSFLFRFSTVLSPNTSNIKTPNSDHNLSSQRKPFVPYKTDKTRPYLNKKARIRIQRKSPLSKMTLTEAVNYAKTIAPGKFLESFEITLNLNIDVRKADQIVRSGCILPHGHGKKKRVVVFAENEQIQEAKDSGVIYAGKEDLAEFILNNKKSFDLVLSTPEAMKYIGKAAKKLGQRGKMPNIKQGTIILGDIKKAINDAQNRLVTFRTRRQPEICCSVGLLNYTDKEIIENVVTVADKILVDRPKSALKTKNYILSAYLKTSQGRSIPLKIGQPPFLDPGPKRKLHLDWGVLSPRLLKRLKEQEEKM